MKIPQPPLPMLPCGCEPHETEMTQWGFHCITEDGNTVGSWEWTA